MPIQLIDLKLIGLHGHAGAGKDTIGLYLHQTYQKVWAESFAGALKNACVEAFGIERKDFDDPELKNVLHPYWGVSPRMIAQFVGTELFRNNIGKLLYSSGLHHPDVQKQGGEDFWINRLEGRLTGAIPAFDGIYDPGDCVVITDLRFQNEYDWLVRNRGIVIHVVRPGYDGAVGIPNHPSEASINFTKPEVTYRVDNDKDLDHLFAQVDTIIGNTLERKSDADSF